MNLYFLIFMVSVLLLAGCSLELSNEAGPLKEEVPVTMVEEISEIPSSEGPASGCGFIKGFEPESF